MKIEYPTIEADSEESEEKKGEKTAKYYGQNNTLGFYPVGRLNAWHGGVHIEGVDAVRAIADGRIISFRLPVDYCYAMDENEKPVYPYSNGFVLMQHNYESPKGQKLRFYSLYMHLMPKKVLKKIPHLFAKYSATVTGVEVASGIVARSGRVVDGSKKGKVVCIIPVGTIVYLSPLHTTPNYWDLLTAEPTDYTEDMGPIKADSWDFFGVRKEKKQLVAKRKLQDAIDNHWSNSQDLKNYAYKRIMYGETTDLYIATTSKFVKDLGDGKLQIISIGAKDKEEKLYKKGAAVFDRPNNQGLGKLLRVDPQGMFYDDLEKISDEWYRIRKKNGAEIRTQDYVHVDALELTIDVNEEIVLDEVQNVDVHVKAGTLLGYSGKYGFEHHVTYEAVHLELFTDDADINKFLSNNAGDDSRKQYEVPANVVLKFGIPVSDLKSGDKVKVFQSHEDYVQIGFEDVVGIVDYDYLKWDDAEKCYTILPDKLTEVSTDLSYDFEESDNLIFVAYVDGAGTTVTKESATHRKVKLEKGRTSQKFWVEKGLVPSSDKQEPYWIALTTDIDTIYENEPTNENDINISVGKKLKVSILSKVTDCNQKIWNKIRGTYSVNGVKNTVEGWIEESKLAVVNPYVWEDFGWQLKEDTGDNYFYQFNAYKQKGEEAPDFIKSIWKLVDVKEVVQSDGTIQEVADNNVLTQLELQRAMKKEEKVNILSKLVCKHKNEWDTWQNLDAFTQEVKDIYNAGIDEEEDTDEKQRMTNIRDERISFMKEKIQNLCFWHQVQDGEVDSLGGLNGKNPAEDKEPRSFPTNNSEVYHFHPIAFIEQMKRIVGLEDIDLSDPDKWMSQFDNPINPKEACYRTSVIVLNNYGVYGAELGSKISDKKYENDTYYYSNTIQMVIQLKDGTLKGTGREQEGISYLNSELEKGHPVVIGLDDGSRVTTYNSDNTTEHFVVITGRLTDKDGLYYRFFEVGTHSTFYNKKNIGVTHQNKLRLTDDKLLIGTKRTCNPYRKYTVVQIRKNK